MGNICSCFKVHKKEYNESLIRDRYCPQCRITFLSTLEYNKHIFTCNQRYGDM